MDYRASWEAWAEKEYLLPVAARAAAQAAIAAAASGAGSWNARIAGHRAAVAAGDEYVCKPDHVGIAIALVVVLFFMLVPATLAGLSVNPAVGGFLMLAAAVALPVLGVFALLRVKRNSCFFVNREIVGRRDWRGRTMAAAPRSMVTSVDVRQGSWDRVLLDDEPQETVVEVQAGRASMRATSTVWWSNSRMKEFAAVAKP
ncbi:MAG TPA: hypothetical protein VFL29_08565 [Candidatus Dormibacteraeota bacterium]|nr:hypothetical protein [Candidatus Dormibacteraeota bacterium]